MDTPGSKRAKHRKARYPHKSRTTGTIHLTAEDLQRISAANGYVDSADNPRVGIVQGIPTIDAIMALYDRLDRS